MSAQSHIELVSNRALLSQVEKDSIATSISTLKTRLNSYYGANLSEQLQFGSSTRGTILPREMDSRSDIDYLIVFCDEEAKPQTYINRLKRFAEKYYTSSQITQSHPTIVLSLNHIKFDLVAARVGFFSEYKIPAPSSTYSEWTTTSPKEFNTQLSDKNKDCSYKFKPAIRVLKYWNARSGYVFDSYSLEQWCADQYYFMCYSTKDYFYSMIEKLSLDWGSAQWRKDKVDRAKQIVANAKQYDSDSMPVSAEQEIKKLVP
ncbi:hypothetical protein N9J84_01090 [Porticoccaceae bacterium]|jgi:hypothetical protein|nr:hypothetical protein [Porticoccaceae bacterium]